MITKSKTIAQSALTTIKKITGEKLTLGRLIWAIRMGEEISQIEFAKTLGISKQHLCDIEKNRKTVSPALAAKYAKNLGYSKTQFIRLALQDMIDREGLNVSVEISEKKQSITKRHANDFAFA